MADKNKIDDLDFSDLDLDGDGGFDEDFTSEDVGPAALDMDERPAKKKPDMFTLGVYGVIGLCVIGAVVWQLGLLGPKNTQPYTAPDMAGNQVVIPGTEAAGDPNAAAAAPSDPFNVMGTPDQVAGANGQPVDAATIDAMTPGDSAIPIPQAGLVGDEIPVTGVMNAADNTPVQNIPVQQPDTLMGDTVPMPSPVSADVSTLPTPVVAQETIAPLPAIAAPTPVKIDAPLVPAVVPAPNASAVSSADMKRVLDRLDALEKRVNAKESSSGSATQAELKELRATITELKSGKIASASSSSNDEATPVVKKAPAKKKTTAKKRKSTSSSESAKKSGSGEWDQPYNSTSTASSSSSYTLRAAQPDAAWVGSNDGSLKQVRVGDSLPGMGTVTGISQSGGQWTVSTTSGRITQ